MKQPISHFLFEQTNNLTIFLPGARCLTGLLLNGFSVGALWGGGQRLGGGPGAAAETTGSHGPGGGAGRSQPKRPVWLKKTTPFWRLK